MTLHEKVSGLIAWRAPDPLCDACVADYLALSPRQVAAASHAVRSDRRLRRFHGHCAGCCTDRVVTMLPSDEQIGAEMARERPHLTARPELR